MKFYIFILLFFFSVLNLKTEKLPGFVKYPYFNEQVKIIKFHPEIRIFINAPSEENFAPQKRTGLALYAIPNGNTIEHTIGKKIKAGDDWHYDIQHIGAQTRYLRTKISEYNLITVYLETAQKSWPTWRKKYSNSSEIIKSILDSLNNMFSQYNPFFILSGHSGGGSFIFGYLDGVPTIPNNIERIVFLDSDYNYDNNLYGKKFVDWISASPNHYLCVIAYNDSIALLNDKPVVSPTGGAWYKSRMFATYLAQYFNFTTSIDTDFVNYSALEGRIKFILKQNPQKAILHTVQVELNGFIHSILTGTSLENNGYKYFGRREYSEFIQDDVLFITPLNIPPRPENAKTGSQFMKYISELNFPQRGNEIFKEISQGNIPNFLRNLKNVTFDWTDSNGTIHKITFEVMPDYLSIGSDEDFCRIPMSPLTAQKLADLFGATLPTRKLVDYIYSNSEIKLEPVTYKPIGNLNETVEKFIMHSAAIDSKIKAAGGNFGQLIAGIKKDVVISNKLTDTNRTHNVCIYGWHQLNGKPIQPLTNIHIDSYVDYSHGIRFLNREFIIDDKVYDIQTVLKDSVLYKILSDEDGPMLQPYYLIKSD